MHNFNCHQCGTGISTSLKEVTCPHCGERWITTCQYCGNALTGVYAQIDGDCGCSGIDYAYEKYLEKRRECEWEREEKIPDAPTEIEISDDDDIILL